MKKCRMLPDSVDDAIIEDDPIQADFFQIYL